VLPPGWGQVAHDDDLGTDNLGTDNLGTDNLGTNGFVLKTR
jgi:hypothetical protein